MCRLYHLCFLVAAVLLIGCVNNPQTAATRPGSISKSKQVARTKGTASRDGGSYWAGDGVTGPARVKIDLGEQRAYLFKGGQLVGVTNISTGRPGYRTPSGNYSVLGKDINHVSGLYGSFVDCDGRVVKSDVAVRTDSAPAGAHFSGASMPYFIRFVGGIGMHAGYLPGYPASHGCVRLPREMAGHFYNNVNTGTPVDVIN
jgi:lipoprotein-anchoring transpeptidase ErfK/SrfK